MGPVAPLDYERWAVLVRPFPVPLSNKEEPSTPSNVVPSIDGSAPSHAYENSTNRNLKCNGAFTGSRNTNDNNDHSAHEVFSVSYLSSDMTDRVFRIFLNEQDA